MSQNLPKETMQAARALADRLRDVAAGNEPVAVVIAATTVLVHAARECGMPADQVKRVVDQLYEVAPKGAS